MDVCPTCQEVFEKRFVFQKYCSDRCRYADPANREKRRLYNEERRNRQLVFIRRVKTFYGCSLCGYKEHASALQFDHINPSEKSFELSQGHTRSISQVKAEMKKCRILCANCHAIHTFNQRITNNDG